MSPFIQTQFLHQHRRSNPPGSRWVQYAQPGNAFALQVHRLGSRSGVVGRLTVARYALDVSRGRRPLPSIADTLPVAEQFRWALKSGYQRWRKLQKYGIPWPYRERFFSPCFSGKNADSRPLSGHQHCFFLPADEDGDGRLDHLTVIAPSGFGADEVRTLDRVRDVPFGDGDLLRLLLLDIGNERTVVTPLFGPSRTWVSAMPFIVTRYPKLRGRKRDRPEDYAPPNAFSLRVLQQELERFGERGRVLPAIERIDPLVGGIGPGRLRPIQFQRFRSRKPGDDGGPRQSGAFRITFAATVHGAICVGHSCHFGLGLFVPEVATP